MSSGSNRKRRPFGRLTFELLEPRVVLDAQLGAALASDLGLFANADAGAAAVSEPADAPKRFASADELQQFLMRDANQRYGEQFGQDTWWWPWLDVTTAGDSRVNLRVSDAGAGDYSTTNIQIAGVDEGDLVKTDGRYLYIGVGPEVTIVDAQSAADMRILSRLGSEGQTAALYLSDHRLTVISQSAMPFVDFGVRHPSEIAEPTFRVTVYDVTAPETPQLISRLELEGNYVDSRMIGQTVYLVSRHQFHLPPPQIVPVHPVGEEEGHDAATSELDPQSDFALRILPWLGSDGDGSGWIYETRDQYWQRIGAQVLDLALPNYALRDGGGTTIAAGLLTAAEATYRPLNGRADQLVSIAAFDIGADQPAIVASASAPVGWGSTVYVSPQNLYVVTADWSTEQAFSEIYKFALLPDEGQIPLAARGRVPGQVLNAFSLDERGDLLRIVTHSGGRADATTALYVLDQVDGKLVRSGQIEGMAPGERLFSVRFVEDLAFVVTFGPQSGVWFDPLFTIDLSDPTSPQVIGELEIPGFSNYLQMIEGEFLIGLGRDADEVNGRQLAPQVSLFDVSDLADPQLTDRVSFGSASSWSEAFFNHHAISYFPEHRVLAVPIDTWFPAGLPIVRERAASIVESSLPRGLSQLWVFRVDITAELPQIRVLGTIEHDRTILRSLRIGEQLFSISGEVIQVHDLFDPGAALGVLYFGHPAEDDWFSIAFGSQDNRLDVLGNDRIRSAGGDWTIASVTQPETGFVAIAADGLSLRYTPAAGFGGTEAFVYTISGPGGITDEARVTVDVNPWADQRRMTELARRDLARRLSVPIEEIGVRSATEVQWQDSCLGIPVPGQACLQVITPGFRIGLMHGETGYIYHTDTGSRVILAKTTELNPPPPNPEIADPVVRVRLEAADAAGQVVTTVKAGETFTLNMYVDDLRDSGAGVYAAYADIFYPARVVGVTEDPIAFDEVYANGRSGDANRAGLLNELGAFGGLQTLGDGERLLASVSFVARRTGTAAFVVTPAGAIGHEVLVYGEDRVVPARLVDWQGVQVQIVGGWRNVELPTDVNDDGRITALDALLGVNAINTRGVLRLEQTDLATTATVATVAGVHFYDVNGDGYLTPEDTLHVINRLNAGNGNPAVGEMPVRPLAAWVDWKSMHDLLLEERWQQPLQTLRLSPERTLRLVHEILVHVDADRLNELMQNRMPFGPAQWKEAIGPVLDAIRSHVSLDQLLDLADQLQTNFDDLDLPAILPGLAPQINLTAAGEALHDAFFAKLSNPLFLLDLLDS